MRIEGLRKMLLLKMAEQDIKQYEVAGELGISERKMSDIINNEEIKSPEDLFSIADFLGKSVEELAGREQEE